jgi:hypothetical protein
MKVTFQIYKKLVCDEGDISNQQRKARSFNKWLVNSWKTYNVRSLFRIIHQNKFQMD